MKFTLHDQTNLQSLLQPLQQLQCSSEIPDILLNIKLSCLSCQRSQNVLITDSLLLPLGISKNIQLNLAFILIYDKAPYKISTFFYEQIILRQLAWRYFVFHFMTFPVLKDVTELPHSTNTSRSSMNMFHSFSSPFILLIFT